MAIITDPDQLAALEAQVKAAPSGQPITDPETLARLEAQIATDHTGEDLKHWAGQAMRWPTEALLAVPNMLSDFGEAAVNGVSKLAGHPANLPYSSDAWRQQLEQAFGAPQGAVEQAADVVMPMAAGGMAAAAPKAASGLSRLAGLLNVAPQGSEVPPSFMTPDETKAQMTAQQLKKFQDAGYVVPPYTAKPSAANWAAETAAGKVAVQQAASLKNQAVANIAASKAVGLNPDAPLTAQALQAVRAQAGKAYEAVRQAGPIQTDETFSKVLESLRDKYNGMQQSFPGSTPSPVASELDTLDVPSFDAGHAIDKITELRDAASAAFRAGNSATGRDFKTLSNGLEDQIERSLGTQAAAQQVPNGIVQNFKAARQLIAKTHTVEDALTDGTNDVSIKALANALKRDEPLTGDLRTAAEFGSAYDKASQSPAKIGSAGINHLGGTLATVMALAGEHATGSLWGLGAGLAYPAARSAATSYALGPAQRGLSAAADGLNDLGPTRAKAAALAQALAQARRLGAQPVNPAQAQQGQ